MPYNRLSTSKIAKIVGCHPNTVRMYEVWGLLPPVPRAPNGYRLYTLDHLDQMRLARTALNTAWPGKTIRKAAFELIHQSARGDLGGALESAYRYLVLVQTERIPGRNGRRVGLTLGTGLSRPIPPDMAYIFAMLPYT